MGEELAGWAAFVGAILMIGLEFWRARKSAAVEAADTGAAPTSRADRVTLTRGVSALSVLGLALVGLAACALHALATSLRWDARYVRDCIGDTCFGTTADQLEADKLELFVSVINVTVVLLWCAFGVLSLRIAFYWLIRVGEWMKPFLRRAQARSSGETKVEASPEAEQRTDAEQRPTRSLRRSRQTRE